MPAPEGNDDPLETELRQLRKTAQPEIQRRIRVIESYVVVWQQGRLDPDLLRAAQREAHRLAGALGMLGFEGATDVARRLNLVVGTAPDPEQADLAAELLTALRNEVMKGPISKVDTSPGGVSPRPARAAQVLLAEDDETIAAAVRVSLRLDGLDLLWARDGAKAVDVARQHAVDLVLLDLDLPILNGLEVCRRLRADPRLATIPIVLMTGHAELSPASDESSFPGFTDYLWKPFKVADLRQRVRVLLAAGPVPPPTS